MNYSLGGKAKELKAFNMWLKVLIVMDKRLTISDLPKLYKIYQKGLQCTHM